MFNFTYNDRFFDSSQKHRALKMSFCKPTIKGKIKEKMRTRSSESVKRRSLLQTRCTFIISNTLILKWVCIILNLKVQYCANK